LDPADQRLGGVGAYRYGLQGEPASGRRGAGDALAQHGRGLVATHFDDLDLIDGGHTGAVIVGVRAGAHQHGEREYQGGPTDHDYLLSLEMVRECADNQYTVYR